MRTIINGNSVPLKWFFVDAVTGTDFDFNHAEVKLTLYSCNYKKELGCSINGNVLETTLPSYLPVGVYSMECTYWIGLGAKRANVIIHEAFQVSRNTAVQPIVNELEFTSIATPIFTTKIATVEYVTEKRYKELDASESLGRRTIYVVKSESGAETIYLYNKELGGETYLPDEEDITLAEKTEEVENEFGELVEQTSMVYKFKDRDTTKGKGYIILRTEKSLVEQMVQENTIYEVRYDFDLGGGTLEVPANCVLCFKGGKISNGHIAFNNTAIDALTDIFENIQYSGKVMNAINVLWFGAKGDASTDDTSAFEAALRCSADYDFNYDSANPGNTIYIPRGTYVTTRTLYVRKGCILQGESCSNTFIHAKIANTGFAFMMGRKSDNSSDSGGLQPIIDNIFIISSWGSRGIQCTEAGYKISNCWFTCSVGISINGVDGIIENCVSDGGQRFLEIYGKDGTDYYNKSHSIIVKGCITFTGYGAINLVGAYGVVISNCAFYYSSNQSIEVYKDSGNIIIDSCDFRTSADPSYYNSESSHIRTTNGALIDSVITNCTFSKSRKCDIYLGRGYNNMISNCLFKDGASKSIWLIGTSDIKVSNNMFVNYPSQPLMIQAPTHINDNVFKNCITLSTTNEYEKTCIKVEQAASSGCVITNNVCDTEGAYVVTFTTNSIDNISRGNISKKHTYDSYVYSGSGGSFENERTWTNSNLAKVHKESYASPSLGSADAGFLFFRTNTTPKKMIMWNGSAWVNIDGTALTTTSEE